jgi:hypothetical protein
MCEVAHRLDQRAHPQGLLVYARRKHSLHFVTEGLWAGDERTGLFEPVRRRSHFLGIWNELQPVQDASSKIDQFLHERPLGTQRQFGRDRKGRRGRTIN